LKYKQHEEDSSSYIEIIIYDKEKETKYRVEKGRISQQEICKYENTIRVEVKIKNGKLNSNKSYDKKMNKDVIRSKELNNYYNENAVYEYYCKRAKRIFGTEKFYRIDVALNIVSNSNELSNNIKEKLCSLLKLVNKEGLTKAKKIWSDTFSSSTFNNHVKKLNELGINIITFDEYIDNTKVYYEYIPNFSLLETESI